MAESQSPNKLSQPAIISAITEVVDPILKRLQIFNPSAGYQPEDVKQTVRRVIKSKKVEGIELLPDQIRFNAIFTDSNQYKLLVAHSCKAYVDLIMQPRFPHLKQKRIPKQQKDFASELDNEIYYLENGDIALT
jgi:hypothetical protein